MHGWRAVPCTRPRCALPDDVLLDDAAPAPWELAARSRAVAVQRDGGGGTVVVVDRVGGATASARTAAAWRWRTACPSSTFAVCGESTDLARTAAVARGDGAPPPRVVVVVVPTGGVRGGLGRAIARLHATLADVTVVVLAGDRTDVGDVKET
jgi:hypothetical protein